MSHVISMDNVRQLNVFSFSKKDSSPRGVKTILKSDLKVGDIIVVGNYFTTIVESEN